MCVCAEGDLERLERNSCGGRRIQGGFAHVEHLGMYDLGKKSVGAWQVGVEGSGMPPAIVFEEEDENGTAATWRCTSCSSTSCNHLTRLFKSQGIKPGEKPGPMAENFLSILHPMFFLVLMHSDGRRMLPGSAKTCRCY